MEKNKQEWIKMKFWTVSAVLGMCLTCFTVLYFFYFSKAHEESRAFEYSKLCEGTMFCVYTL